jgi:hypothetical protein
MCRMGCAGLGAILILLAAATVPSTAIAAGETYTVLQCHRLNRGHADAVFEDAPAYSARSFCAGPDGEYAVKITNTGDAQNGRSGRVRWSTGTASLGLVSVDLTAKLRRHSGHAARLWLADSRQREVARMASGSQGRAHYRRYRWESTGRAARQLIASLSCEWPQGCRRSDYAKTWVRDVRLKVADYADPEFTALNGTVLADGWLRGAKSIHAQASDSGSGLSRLAIVVNGVQLAGRNETCQTVEATSYASRIQPCDGEDFLTLEPSTGERPFRDGQNALSVCAVDFGGNRTCAEHTVRVDNSPPTLDFTNSQNPSDPELIRAPVSDATSGVRSGQILYRPVGEASWRLLETQVVSGQLQARVDSTLDLPGQYEFTARATDIAGNLAQATTRANGQPMVLTFPLKAGVSLSGHLAPGGRSRMTIGYHRSAKVAGRLLDASGKPLANQKVTVVEYFGSGALIDRRVRTLETDSDGLWGERLPAGPSRAVRAIYEGSSRYLADHAKAGKLRVRTKATLHLSRHRVPEGRRVVFRGRVAHRAARIPAGGKLIELQVKDGRHWHTVRHALYTRSNGRYRLPYRFATFYASNVRYRFRLRVLRERGWPYKAPVTSRAKRLVVRAR